MSADTRVEEPRTAPGDGWRHWVQGRRIRVHALLLAVCLWSLWAISVSTPGVLDRSGTLKGADFLQFYAAGSLAAEPAQLYDARAFAERARELVPAAADTHYLPIYGPQVALLFAPLAVLPFGQALTLTIVVGLLVHALCVFSIWRRCPRLREHATLVWIVASAQPALFACVGFGQLGGLALAAFTGAFLALEARRPFLAGVALGLLAYKPQLGLVAGVVFLLNGHGRVVCGALACGAAQLLCVWLAMGAEAITGYLEMLMRLESLASGLAHSPHQMHSLRAFCDLLLPGGVALPVYVLAALAVTAGAARAFGRPGPLALRFSLLLIATVLANPHLYLYDLLVLAPVWLLLADRCLARPDGAGTHELRILLYASFVLPVLGPLAQWTHVQLSVVAFAALALRVARDLAQSEASPSATPASPARPATPATGQRMG